MTDFAAPTVAWKQPDDPSLPLAFKLADVFGCRIEDIFAWYGYIAKAFDKRTRNLNRLTLKGENFLQIPTRHIGKAEQLQGGPGGRGVNDNDIIFATVGQRRNLH